MHSLLFTYSPLLHDCTLRSGTHRSIQPTRTYRPHLPGPLNAVLIRPAALRAIGEKILERKCSCIAYLHSSNFSTSNYRVPILSVPPHRWNTTTTKQTDKDCCLIPHTPTHVGHELQVEAAKPTLTLKRRVPRPGPAWPWRCLSIRAHTCQGVQPCLGQ